MIYNEEPHKIQKINDKLITLNQKVSNYNTDFNSKATEAHYNKGKKVYTYESEWITLQPDELIYGSSTYGIYYNLYDSPGYGANLIGGAVPGNYSKWDIMPFIPQFSDFKELSARLYSGFSYFLPSTNISSIFPQPEYFFTWRAIFKTAPEYQNQLKTCFPTHRLDVVQGSSPGIYFSSPYTQIFTVAQSMVGSGPAWTSNYSFWMDLHIAHQAVGIESGVYGYAGFPRGEERTIYAPPVISIQGKIIMSIYNPR